VYFYWLITKANSAFPYDAASTLPQQNSRPLTQDIGNIEKRKMKRKKNCAWADYGMLL